MLTLNKIVSLNWCKTDLLQIKIWQHINEKKTFSLKTFFFLYMIRCWLLLQLCIILRGGRCQIYWFPQLSLPYIYIYIYVWHDEFVHLQYTGVNTYLIFFPMNKFRGSTSQWAQRDCLCNHSPVHSLVTEVCVWNLVLIHLHCTRN